MSFILLGILNSQALGGAVASDYDLLETEILTSSTTTLTFSNLNTTYGSDYKHLQIRMSTQQVSYSDLIFIRYNNDAGTTSYRSHRLYGNGSSVVSSASDFSNPTQSSYGYLYYSTAVSNTDNFSAGIVDILDPFNSSKYTVTRTMGGGTPTWVSLFSNVWMNTAAVDSISIYTPASIAADSRISLYGLKASA